MSFFSKLKKNTEVEIDSQTEDLTTSADLNLKQKEEKTIKSKKITVAKEPVENVEAEENEEGGKEIEAEELSLSEEPIKEKENWFESEGQLAVDVFQTNGEIIIQAAIAGVESENLDISIENDMIVIKGNREKPKEPAGKRNYFFKECYWGPFSRKIILSEEVDAARAEATMKDGIFTLKIPRIERVAKKKVEVKG